MLLGPFFVCEHSVDFPKVAVIFLKEMLERGSSSSTYDKALGFLSYSGALLFGLLQLCNDLVSLGVCVPEQHLHILVSAD